MRPATLLPILLLTPPALTAQQTQPERVAGKVVSSRDGHPLPRAQVTLTRIQGEKETASTTADTEGRFRFDPVPPGKYRITATAAGYLSSAYLPHLQYSSAIVTGAGLETGSISLQLTPVASLSGHIRDDDGDPIPRAMLTLYREDPTNPKHITRLQNTQSSEDGDYQFLRLAPGRYYLSANATPWFAVHPPPDTNSGYIQYRTSVDPGLDVAYPTTFYPNATDDNGASPLVVTGGEQLSADLQMHAQHAVAITLRSGPGDQQNGRAPQLSHLVFGQDETMTMQSTASYNGVLQINGIAPGQYSLQETAPNGLVIRSRPVDLTASTSVDTARAPDLATLLITAHMADGGSLPAGLQISLRGSNLNRSTSGRASDKGTIELKDIPPGDYTLTAFASRSLSVLNLAVDGKPAPDHRIHVAGSGSLKADLTLSAASVQVEGFARHDGKPAVGAMVVLVPAGADSSEQLFRRDQSDLDGSFVMNNVVPGNYILIAIDDAWQLRWPDIPTLAPYLLHGTPVSVPVTTAPIHLPEPVAVQPRETR